MRTRNVKSLAGAALFAAVLIMGPAAAFAAGNALQFDGTNDYVTFGADTVNLGLTKFTVELWFYRTGTGVTTSTGTGGITAIPLFTKGRGEADGSKLDMNYFLGIRGTDNVLCADYEEGTGQTSPGLNHPVAGVTAIRNNTWYHAAATFDGTTWRLYLNGVLETELVVGASRLPQDQSIQHAGLATAMTSTGVAAGYFLGRIDEARIWGRALTQQEIVTNMGLELTSGTGLNGRWGLNDGTGTNADNSISASPDGTLTNGPVWIDGCPFAASNSLKLGASNAYATFGNPPALGLAQFTIETWFRRDGAGTAVSTGTGGITALPLVTHGSAQAEGNYLDMNWFLGIRSSDNVICADFEEATTGATPGLNHPIAGVTPIVTGQWYHAAATYDGTSWKLYLNGLLENTLSVGQPPESNTLQHAGLGTFIKSDSTTSGYFNGTLDEVRVWSYARTRPQVDSTINDRIAGAKSGLVARWGLDEGAGTVVRSSAGATLPGRIKGTGSSWDYAAPFNIVLPTPPSPPTNLAATAISYAQIHLGWTDASSDELSFEIQRSTGGSGGPFSPLATLPAGATSYEDHYLSPVQEYCYRVCAVNAAGPSAWCNVACATTPAENARALDFGGSTAYVTFGRPAALDLQTFTIETWFRRDGVGTTANTGSGGVYAIPLVTKGVGQEDGDRRDMNFFLGIRGTDSVLCADFEDVPAGQNHPILGVTPIHIGTWHHAAATYDGTTWRLYLDGMLESELVVNATPQGQSWQHAGLAAAFDTAGTATGHFDGVLDEARIWDHARSAQEIRATINEQLAAPEPGLAARWALNEGAGTTVHGSAGTAVTGAVANTGWSWTGPAPFDVVINDAPGQPVLIAPPDGATGVAFSPTLDVTVADPENDPLTVTFYGRPKTSATGSPFTIAFLPDAQYYTSETNGGTVAVFQAQAQWIVDSIAARNIVYAHQIGDFSENGDTHEIQWERGWSAMQLLENPSTTHLPEGLPYGVTVGNHDQTPGGSATGTTNYYNEYFGVSHFTGRSYYGGHYASNNDSHFELFSSGNLAFVVISMEYDTAPDAPVLAWADSLLKAYPMRRGIVCTHNLITAANPGVWSAQGQAVYDALKDNANLSLMLCGHSSVEGRRSDTYGGHVIHTILADYQTRTNGGDGWMRIMTFYPDENVLRVKTYSPTLGQWETDADSSSQFTLPFELTPLAEWSVIGTLNDVPSGSHAEIAWPGLSPSSGYEWYVTVTDGNSTTTSPTWDFTTRSSAPTAAVVYPNGGEILAVGAGVTLQWTADDDVGVTSVDLLLSRDGAAGSYAPIAMAIANTGTYEWTVDGAATANAFLKAVAHDADDNTGEDVSDAAFSVTVITDAESSLPSVLALEIASAHPFNGAGAFGLAVPRASNVRISVYDVSGRRVATLVDAAYQPGRYRIAWNGATAHGSAASGIYFFRLEACGKILTKKIVLVR